MHSSISAINKLLMCIHKYTVICRTIGGSLFWFFINNYLTYGNKVNQKLKYISYDGLLTKINTEALFTEKMRPEDISLNIPVTLSPSIQRSTMRTIMINILQGTHNGKIQDDVNAFDISCFLPSDVRRI